ncbi:hypothetical protein [Halorientalis pallida]|uniref:Uncharacterized protein n=1 Tax=Halorientalis pallida TaxID=2479928 RepID=A0A498L0L1_9EURY|nr:hypothetical protein [Halorientalis pallida]RXK48033.1 hypothetical protein EAF64_15505 [Halorientalis pallida]
MTDQRTLTEFTEIEGDSADVRDTADYHVEDSHAHGADPDTSPTLCGSPIPSGRFHVVLDPSHYDEVSPRDDPLTPGVYLWHNANADFQDAPSEVATSDAQLREAVEAAWDAITAVCDDIEPVVGFHSGVRWSSLNIHMADRERGDKERVHCGYGSVACPERDRETTLQHGFASIRLFGTPVDTLICTPDPRLGLEKIESILTFID